MDPTNRAANNDLQEVLQAQLAPGLDDDAGLDALRACGAHQFDPIRFKYLEALALRVRGHHGALRASLDQRLAQAVSAYGTSYETALSELNTTVPALVLQYPQAAQALHKLHADGDVRAVRQLAARLAVQSRSGPLADLVRQIDGHFDGPTAAQTPAGAGALDAAASSDTNVPMAELKTVQRFRETWTRLRVDNQLTRSQEKVPENSGPLNSHLLVLRSLRRMQEISPAYLERFMAHVDGLLWLEHAGLRGPAAAGKTVVPGTSKRKAKVGTSKSG